MVNIGKNIQKVLSSTKEKRPIGNIADKMTPNKRTGHINAMIVPVPENPLAQSLLVPLMICSPPVKDHSAFGVEDSQIEGEGFDGQYINLGVWEKLLQSWGHPSMSLEQLRNWFPAQWEPAHNINLADGDVRKLDIFD